MPKVYGDRQVLAGDSDAPLVVPDTDPRRVEIRNLFITVLNQRANGIDRGWSALEIAPSRIGKDDERG